MLCRVDDLFQSVPGQPSVSVVQRNGSHVVDQVCSAKCLCVVRSFENHQKEWRVFHTPSAVNDLKLVKGFQ